MEFTGQITEVNRDYKTGQFKVTFTMNESPSIEELMKLCDAEIISVKATKPNQKRSLNANGLFWECVGRIANSMPGTDKWTIYLELLKRYGKFTYLCVKKKAVEAVKEVWRECEDLGPIKIGDEEGEQLLCYFGSSTYDTKEFSRLLEGTIAEMREMGLQVPTSERMQESLKEWERQHV